MFSWLFKKELDDKIVKLNDKIVKLNDEIIKDICKNYVTSIQIYKSTTNKLIKQHNDLIDLLEEYGQHHQYCNRSGGDECICGWTKITQKYRKIE
jgi:hypothetical protein